MPKFLVTVDVMVEADSKESALNIVEDAINSYKPVDLALEDSDVLDGD